MITWLISIIVLIVFSAMIVPRLVTAIYGSGRTYSVDTVPSEKTAIVFGAGLWWDGRPTPVFARPGGNCGKLVFFRQGRKDLNERGQQSCDLQ